MLNNTMRNYFPSLDYCAKPSSHGPNAFIKFIDILIKKIILWISFSTLPLKYRTIQMIYSPENNKKIGNLEDQPNKISLDLFGLFVESKSIAFWQ